jgi:hypothetical protein
VITKDSDDASWKDYVKVVYEDLTMNDEYILFIEA